MDHFIIMIEIITDFVFQLILVILEEVVAYAGNFEKLGKRRFSCYCCCSEVGYCYYFLDWGWDEQANCCFFHLSFQFQLIKQHINSPFYPLVIILIRLEYQLIAITTGDSWLELIHQDIFWLLIIIAISLILVAIVDIKCQIKVIKEDY